MSVSERFISMNILRFFGFTVALIESASRFPHCMAAARRARAGFRKFEIFANFRKFGTGTREYQ